MHGWLIFLHANTRHRLIEFTRASIVMTNSEHDMSNNDCAKTDGTARYCARFKDAAEGHFRQAQDLWMSSIGIGTYLGQPDEQTDRRTRALSCAQLSLARM